MSTIFIADESGQQASYSEDQARGLWAQGAISPSSLYWREGMPEWGPAAEFFGSSAAAAAAPPVLPPPVPRGFAQDPARLTRFLTKMLWASLVMSALAAIAAVVSMATGNATQSTDDEMTLMDGIEFLVGLTQFVVWIVTLVTLMRWIYRANLNARGLGAQGMTFTPGWSVGWYFVPIANLWKPYQAMKEIWQASCNPRAWSTITEASQVGTWWTLFLLSTILGNLAFRLSLMEGAELALLGTVTAWASDVMDLPLCLVSIRLVKSIYEMQRRWVEQP